MQILISPKPSLPAHPYEAQKGLWHHIHQKGKEKPLQSGYLLFFFLISHGVSKDNYTFDLSQMIPDAILGLRVISVYRCADCARP